MSKVHSIEELKQKCAERNMPLEKMRFFIGEDRKEPKCFGIYQDEKTGNWIVYKNKADGQRAVRYAGPDEAHAAQEIWNKIGSEVKQRKDKYANPYDESVYRSIEPEPVHKKVGGFFAEVWESIVDVWTGLELYHKILVVFAIAIMIGVVIEMVNPPLRRGYYRIGEDTYYNLSNQWYLYDSGGWVSTYVDVDDVDDYYIGDEYSDDYGITNFKDTEYFADYVENDQDYDYNYNDDDYEYDDDDYDYDYDDWDADDTDWDTDW